MPDVLSQLLKIWEMKAGNTSGNYRVYILWVSKMVKIQSSVYMTKMALMGLTKFRC